MGRKKIRRKKKSEKRKYIGIYQLGAELGKGAFGCVWQAMNTKTGDFVAIKEVSLVNAVEGKYIYILNFKIYLFYIYLLYLNIHVYIHVLYLILYNY